MALVRGMRCQVGQDHYKHSMSCSKPLSLHSVGEIRRFSFRREYSQRFSFISNSSDDCILGLACKQLYICHSVLGYAFVATL